MTCVCSVGLDMIAVPGDTRAETISAIIADEAAIGMINNKTTAVRMIPAIGKSVGDWWSSAACWACPPWWRAGDAGQPLALDRFYLRYACCGSSFGRSRFFVARRLARG